MTEQTTIFGDTENVDERGLGDNQRLVLAAIRQHGRVERDEAGALIHEKRGHHSADERCDYCARDGRHVLASLSAKGFKNGRPRRTTAAPSNDLPADF